MVERKDASFSLAFEGCFGKSGVQNVVFCGENVVNCVVNVDEKLPLFAVEKWDMVFNYFFLCNPI